MIPRCYPTNSAGEMIVFELTDTTGKRKWVDYIPVESVAATGTNVDRYQDAGAKSVQVLLSVTGLTAWRDYIPVDTVTASNWRSDDAGCIPVVDPA